MTTRRAPAHHVQAPKVSNLLAVQAAVRAAKKASSEISQLNFYMDGERPKVKRSRLEV
jgi:hypothetical protein